MLIYRDVISGDEMLSDIYKLELVDDVVYEVEGKQETFSTTVDESKLGANASAEGGDEEAADPSCSQSGINIVMANRLVQTHFEKKDYMAYIKGYMKALEKHLAEHNPDRVEPFKKGAQKYVKQILSQFKQYEFFMGESLNAEAMCPLLIWKNDGATPYMVFFKDGLKEEKV